MPTEPHGNVDRQQTSSAAKDGAYHAGRAFTTHPDGFAVFLSPDELDAADTYESGASYSTGVRTAFDRWRADCTLHLVNTALRSLGRDPRILDLGCGDGYITAEIENAWPHAEIRGLDYSLAAIRRAVRRCPRAQFVVADACSPPYADAQFDLVVCNNIYEHVPDPVAMLRAIARILAPSGVLVVSTPNRYRLNNLLRALSGLRPTLNSPLHVTEYSLGQVEEQFRYGGFEVISRALHRPMPPLGPLSLRGAVLRYVAKPVVLSWLKLVRSHHQLEPTLFVAARRRSC